MLTLTFVCCEGAVLDIIAKPQTAFFKTVLGHKRSRLDASVANSHQPSAQGRGSIAEEAEVEEAPEVSRVPKALSVFPAEFDAKAAGWSRPVLVYCSH